MFIKFKLLVSQIDSVFMLHFESLSRWLYVRGYGSNFKMAKISIMLAMTASLCQFDVNKFLNAPYIERYGVWILLIIGAFSFQILAIKGLQKGLRKSYGSQWVMNPIRSDGFSCFFRLGLLSFPFSLAVMDAVGESLSWNLITGYFTTSITLTFALLAAASYFSAADIRPRFRRRELSIH